MIVRMEATVLGFDSGDVVDLPADYPGLKGAIAGGYVTKLTKAEARDALGAADPLSVDDSASDDDDALDSAEDVPTS